MQESQAAGSVQVRQRSKSRHLTHVV